MMDELVDELIQMIGFRILVCLSTGPMEYQQNANGPMDQSLESPEIHPKAVPNDRRPEERRHFSWAAHGQLEPCAADCSE